MKAAEGVHDSVSHFVSSAGLRWRKPDITTVCVGEAELGIVWRTWGFPFWGDVEDQLEIGFVEDEKKVVRRLSALSCFGV